MISWEKFSRRINNELSRNPKERSQVNEFIMSATEEYDRITETSPTIDKDMIDLFKTTFDGRFTTKDTRQFFQEITKPDILDKLVSVRQSVYKEPEIIIPVEDVVIGDFSKKFMLELGRSPTRDEILDNLGQEVRPEHIAQFFRRNHIEEV
jgi:hypothetical protein